MNDNRPYLFYNSYRLKITLAILSLMFVLSSCTTPPLESEDQEERIPVKVAFIKQNGFTQSIELSGRSRSQLDFPIIAPSPMTVKEVFVQIGDQVKEGEVLLTFDNEQAKNQLEQAQKQVQALEQNVVKLENAQHQLLEQNRAMGAQTNEAVNQAQAVLEGAQTGAVTMLDLLQASTQLLLLQNQMQSLPPMESSSAMSPVQLQAQLEQAKVQVQLAEEAIESLTVQAPFDGVVTYRNIEPKGVALPGSPIIQLSNLEKIIVDVQVGSTHIQQLRKGLKAQVLFEGEKESMEATLDALSTGTSLQSSVYQAQIYLDNQDGSIFPGKLATIVLETQRIPNVLLVPVEAVFYENEKAYVYLVKANKAQLKEISLGERNESFYIIEKGLKLEDMVITIGRERVSDGRAVYVQK